LRAAIDIEKQLTVSDANSTSAQPAPFVPLANGCICCSVKDVGVAAIENLMEQSGLFDYILLETTGLADPGNIAPMFWLDDGLGSSIFLDGIVTLVDAKNVLKSLDEGLGDEENIQERKKAAHDEHGPLLTTAHLQISHADVVIINKTDLVTQEELDQVTQRVRSINGLARIKTTTKSQVPELEGLVLDLNAYDKVSDADLKFASKGHSHLDPTITTSTISFPALTREQVDKYDFFLRTVLWDETLPNNVAHNSFEIHRLKGRAPVTDGKMLLTQGVRSIYDTNELDDEVTEGSAEGKLVLIGRGVDQEGFKKSLIATLGL
jgi:G3E family GTPase